MTTPTGPDDERGQETCSRPGCRHPKSKHTADGRRLCWADLHAFRRCSCSGWLPAPQQPPAPEREVPRQCWPHQRDASGRCMACGDYGEYTADDSDLLVPDDDDPPSAQERPYVGDAAQIAQALAEWTEDDAPTQKPEPGSPEWHAIVEANKAAGWRCGRGLAEGFCDNPEHAQKWVRPAACVPGCAMPCDEECRPYCWDFPETPESDRARILVFLSTLFGTGHSWPRSGQTRQEMTEASVELVREFVRSEAAMLAASSGVRGWDDQARERLADVLALHVEGPYKDCRACSRAWPCATAHAAGGAR